MKWDVLNVYVDFMPDDFPKVLPHKCTINHYIQFEM